MKSSSAQLQQLLRGMRATYARGGNAMAYAREYHGSADNPPIATLIAYDLQTGSYVAAVKRDPAANEKKCTVLAEILHPYITEGCSLLDVGCGEATTLAGLLQRLPLQPQHTLGFDISWSRCAEGLDWLAQNRVTAELFVADLFDIPLADASIDVVYTSHALEPNGGREEAAIRELLRVSRRAVVLLEPAYEFASEEAQGRMRQHGYVRNLKQTAKRLGATIVMHCPIAYSENPLNPTGLLILKPPHADPKRSAESGIGWQCPLTSSPLTACRDAYVAAETGMAYPVLRGVPLLRSEHGVVASRLARSTEPYTKSHPILPAAALRNACPPLA